MRGGFFGLFTAAVGVGMAFTAIFFFGIYVAGIGYMMIRWPMWGWPWFAINTLAWNRAIRALSKHLHGREFPKEMASRKNLPSALD